MNLAIVENDTVVNVIVCDTVSIARELTGAIEILDSDEHKIYMGYTRKDGVWYPPVIE